MKYTQQDLIRGLAKELNKSQKDIERYLIALQGVVERGLSEDKQVKISGLGSFVVEWKKERKSVDVRTGESIVLPGHNQVVFAPDMALKEIVNTAYSHLEIVTLDDEDVAEGLLAQPEPELVAAPIAKVAEQAKALAGILDEINAPVATTENVVTSDTAPVLEVKNEEEEPEKNIPGTTDMQESNTTEDRSAEHSPNIFGSASLVESVPPMVAKKKRPLLWAIVFVLLFIGAGYGVYYFSMMPHKENVIVAEVTEETPERNESVENVVVADTVVVDNEPEEDEFVAEISSQFDSSFGDPVFDKRRNYTDFVDDRPLNEGSRLAWIAYKQWGHKKFWVYLYEANIDRISDPNNIAVGTMIKIPRLPAELIDLNNPRCVEYAEELHDHYVK